MLEEENTQSGTFLQTAPQVARDVSPLHAASFMGNKTVLKKLLENVPPNMLEAKDDLGRTPLIYSVMGNHVQCLSLLVHAGARLDNSDQRGETPLHWACFKGYHRCVRFLLAGGALWHQKDRDGVTALHLATQHSSTKCLSLILKELSPGEVDIQDTNKRSALHWSASCGNLEHIRMLLKQGANICLPDKEGKTPLHLTACCNDVRAADCIRIMLDEAPNAINWQDYAGNTSLHYATMMGTVEVVDVLTSRDRCHISMTDNLFCTPLHWASESGMPEKVGLLLDRGANHGAMDSNGATPLHYAAQNNHKDTVAVFMSRRYVKDKPDAQCRTALMWAAASGADESIRILVNSGFDVNARDKHGATALHIASGHGCTSTIELLLELGADIDSKDESGMTPLLHGCEMGRVKAVLLLIGHDASLQATDFDGRSPFHWAALGGHAYLCQVLIQKGCNPDNGDFYGRTALHYASYRGYINCMLVLLDGGADLNRPDNEGKTPLHWASTKGNLSAVKLLCDYDAVVNAISVTPKRCTPLDCSVTADYPDITEFLTSKGGVPAELIRSLAALKIQACYRGYAVRKHLAHLSRLDSHHRADTESHVISQPYTKEEKFPMGITERPIQVTPMNSDSSALQEKCDNRKCLQCICCASRSVKASRSSERTETGDATIAAFAVEPIASSPSHCSPEVKIVLHCSCCGMCRCLNAGVLRRNWRAFVMALSTDCNSQKTVAKPQWLAAESKENQAATIIQRSWKRYYRQRALEEMKAKVASVLNKAAIRQAEEAWVQNLTEIVLVDG